MAFDGMGFAAQGIGQDKQFVFDQFNNALAYHRTRELMDKQKYNQMDLNNMAFRQNLDALAKSPERIREGLESAGINPQIMAGSGSFSQAAQSSAGSATGGTATAISNSIGSLQFSQSNLMDAQAEKIRAETEQLERVNTNQLSEQETIDNYLRHNLQKDVDNPDLPEDARKFAKTLLDNTARDFDKGTLNALASIVSYKQSAQNFDLQQLNLTLKKLETALQAKVLQIQNSEDSSTPKYLADIPRQEWLRTTNDIARLNTLTALQAAQVAMTPYQVSQIEADVKRTYAELSKTYHQDFASMWANKDYSAFFTSLLVGATEQAIGLGADLLLFKGLGSIKRLQKGAKALQSNTAKDSWREFETRVKKGADRWSYGNLRMSFSNDKGD